MVSVTDSVGSEAEAEGSEIGAEGSGMDVTVSWVSWLGSGTEIALSGVGNLGSWARSSDVWSVTLVGDSTISTISSGGSSSAWCLSVAVSAVVASTCTSTGTWMVESSGGGVQSPTSGVWALGSLGALILLSGTG